MSLLLQDLLLVSRATLLLVQENTARRRLAGGEKMAKAIAFAIFAPEAQPRPGFSKRVEGVIAVLKLQV